MRRDARKLAFSLIFERLFNSKPEDSELWEQIKEKDKPLAEEIFSNYINHSKQIEGEIEKVVVGYELNRLHKVDLALIMTAICEIEYVKTPAPVAINEYVEIAKSYSTSDGPKFINGVLSSYLKGKESK